MVIIRLLKCQPEPVEGGLLVLDFASRFSSSQFSSNNASFFFLDQPLICFSKAIA
jgi:hypothetical protein